MNNESMISTANHAAELRDYALVLDTETTGGTANAEIIELGIVTASNGQILINQLYKPTQGIDFHAARTHGIKDSNLTDAPRIAQHWEAIHNILHGKTVLAWNASQDKRYLEQTIARYRLAKPEITWVCAMHLYKRFKGLSQVCKLSEACKAMNVKQGCHRATDDALATARIIYRIANIAHELEERAAIYEYESHISRAEAEARAIEDYRHRGADCAAPTQESRTGHCDSRAEAGKG